MSEKVRSAYVWSLVIGQLVMLAAAVLIPVYVTPGYYWWTAFFVFLVAIDGYALGLRMNLWEGKI